MKAVLPLAGTVLASDAFFPFPDGFEEAAKHGITAAIQPGGLTATATLSPLPIGSGSRWSSPGFATSGR